MNIMEVRHDSAPGSLYGTHSLTVEAPKVNFSLQKSCRKGEDI